MSTLRIVVSTVLFLCGPLLPAQTPDTTLPRVPDVLLNEAIAVLKKCEEKKITSLGVLKFQVSKDGKTFPANVGSLNTYLARSFETALFIRNTIPDKPIDITEDASAVAAKLPNADFRTQEGRNELFAAKYSRRWGKTQITPELFVVGLAMVDADLQKITFDFVLVDRDGHTRMNVMSFARMEPWILAEINESYNLAGSQHTVLYKAIPTQTPVTQVANNAQTSQIAANVRQQAAKSGIHPLQDASAPVKVIVNYDELPQKYDFTSGEARIVEPKEGQKVTLNVVRQVKEKLKVVVKVNGENTLYRQISPDYESSGWLLEPNDPPQITISGYQNKEMHEETFRIRSDLESKLSEKLYGANVGTISISVFRESTMAILPPVAVRDQQARLVAMAAPVRANDTEQNYHKAFDNFMKSPDRGLIAPGTKVPSSVVSVTNNWDPTPIMTATLSYYKTK